MEERSLYRRDGERCLVNREKKKGYRELLERVFEYFILYIIFFYWEGIRKFHDPVPRVYSAIRILGQTAGIFPLDSFLALDEPTPTDSEENPCRRDLNTVASIFAVFHFFHNILLYNKSIAFLVEYFLSLQINRTN
jgi:DMSO/TMAO reductase YedYZ heme-binding membrane subunit